MQIVIPRSFVSTGWDWRARMLILLRRISIIRTVTLAFTVTIDDPVVLSRAPSRLASISIGDRVRRIIALASSVDYLSIFAALSSLNGITLDRYFLLRLVISCRRSPFNLKSTRK
jgi:hypothetical protein